MTKDMLELAERCEKATGPDEGIDSAITYAVVTANWADKDSRWDTYDWPKFTASLDAAMTLVPEGWRVGQLEENWRSGRWHSHITQRPSAALIDAFDAGKTIGYDSKEAEAATPALALCAAALRARANNQGG